jgi:hypothetical protein
MLAHKNNNRCANRQSVASCPVEGQSAQFFGAIGDLSKERNEPERVIAGQTKGILQKGQEILVSLQPRRLKNF